MQRPLRVLAASLALAALFMVATLASPAQAGSATTPEVTDGADDQTEAGAAPALCVPSTVPVEGGVCQFDRADILAGWVDNETATDVQVHIQVTGPVDSPSANTQYDYSFNFAVGGQSFSATATLANGACEGAPVNQCVGGALTFGGVAANGSAVASVITMTVPKSALGLTAGAAMTNLAITAKGSLLGQSQASFVSDAAPNSGFGTDYTFQSGNNTANPSDADGDGLNDTWETKYFNSTSAQNATGDPDKDGCSNKCEFDHGTNPTKADTDGDGCSDGDEVKGSTNPNDPTSHPAACGGTTTSSSSSSSGSGTSSSSSTSHPSSSSSTSSTTSEGSPNYGEYLAGAFGDEGHFFLLIACALTVVVLVLSLIGRGGRWGL